MYNFTMPYLIEDPDDSHEIGCTGLFAGHSLHFGKDAGKKLAKVLQPSCALTKTKRTNESVSERVCE